MLSTRGVSIPVGSVQRLWRPFVSETRLVHNDGDDDQWIVFARKKVRQKFGIVVAVVGKRGPGSDRKILQTAVRVSAYLWRVQGIGLCLIGTGLVVHIVVCPPRSLQLQLRRRPHLRLG